MRCYIQKIKMKSSNSIGCGKELWVTTTNWAVNGVTYTSYGYTFSEDRFERPVKTAYKVTIHDKSYRDNKGKVTKKQYHVATIKYYDLIDFNWFDCVEESKIDNIAEQMNINPDLIWEEITRKLDSLQEKINKEFKQTEEYEVKKKHDAILKKYRIKKQEFAEKYKVQENEYDSCFDVFGKLRNKEYFEKIKRESDKKKNMKKKVIVIRKNIKVITMIILAVMGQAR